MAKTGMYVLQGIVPSEVAAAPFDVKVIDAYNNAGRLFTPAEVAQMGGGPGRSLLLGYFSIGEAETYRDYFSTIPSAAVGPENPQWPGNFEVAYWTPEWRAVATAYVDRLVRAGYDGVYFDVVDEYQQSWARSHAPGGAAGAEQAMVSLVKYLADYAHSINPSFKVWANNAEELLENSSYLKTLDGMFKENLYYTDSGSKQPASETNASLDYLRLMTAAGKDVIAIEYVSGATKIADVQSHAARDGFGVYVAHLDLNGIDYDGVATSPPPSPDPGAGHNFYFNFNFTAAHVSFTNGHELVQAPNGAITDVTGAATLAFSDGIITEKDGQPLVDDLFYFARNPDVWAAHIDPDLHYAINGWREGRDPNAYFSTTGYLAANPDVAAAHINPLMHYDQNGWREGRDASTNFDTSSYLAANPDVAAAHVDPLAHYLASGQAEGRSTYTTPGSFNFNFNLTAAQVSVANGQELVRAPNGTVTNVTGATTLTFNDGTIVQKDGQPLVDDLFYFARNPDVWAAHIDPDLHYAINGWREGRDPNAYFSTKGYLATNPDVAAAHINPLMHYDQNGWREGRDAGPAFDTSSYLSANPDVAAAHIDPLAHYLLNGMAEGRLLA